MDDGICIVSSIMGGYDGPINIRCVEITTTAPIVTYCGLVQHLLSGPRLPFTAAYFGSIALTLYFSIGVSDRPFGAWWSTPALDGVPLGPSSPLTPLASPFYNTTRHFARFAISNMRHY